MLLPLISSLVVFLTVFLLCIGIFFLIQRKASIKSQAKRVEKAVNIQTTGYSESSNQSGEEYNESLLRRDTRVSSIPWLNNLLSKFLKERAKVLMILIEQSGLRIKVSEFLLFIFFVGFLGALLIDLLIHIPVIGFILGLFPLWLLNFLKEKRVDTFVKQLPQALDSLSGDLRAGLDVTSGLKHLSEEFPAPIGEEFAKVVAEVNLGLTLNEALNNLSKRVNAMDVQILCTGIIINRELGGNLSELIGSIGETVRERFRLKGMVKALTAENQMSAILLVVLPIALYILLNVLAPATYNSFIKDPMGQMILGACAVSMTIGYMIIQKITKLEV